MSQENFKFWVPLELSKAKDAKGNTIMKIGGIASTNAKDTDGEFLDPNGFDVSYFKKNGFLNWHHSAKENPNAIIGEPTKAEIRKDGLYIEGELYGDNPMAKSVYDMAKVLEKNSKTRRLGFSIEGRALQRKSEDKDHPDYKIVQKAAITGCAITFAPKNPKTFLDIIKGGIDEAYDLEFSEEDEKVMKALSAGSDTGMDTVNSTQASGAPLKEDDSDEETDLTKTKKKTPKTKYLEKSEVYERIFEKQPGITLFEAEKIYQYISKSKTMAEELNKIEKSDVEKALEMLDASVALVKAKKAEDDEDLDAEDAPDYDDSDDDGSMDKASAYCSESMTKAKSKSKIMGSLMKKGFSSEKAKEAYDKVEKAMKDKENEEIKKSYEAKKKELEDMEKSLVEKGILDKTFKPGYGPNDKVEKGEEAAALNTAPETLKEGFDIQKGLGDVEQLIKEKNYSVGVILKGIYDLLGEQKEDISTLVTENGDLKKALSDSQEQINTISTSLEDLNKSLDESTPGRKSVVTSKPRERQFTGNDELNKAQNNSLPAGSKAVNFRSRKEVLNVLDQVTFEKGFDQEFGDALARYESTGNIDAHIAKRLKDEKGIHFING